MDTSKVDHRLRVAFLSLPQRSQAVLEYFFATTGHGSFQLVQEQAAEAAIFDFDNPDSRQHWESFHAQTGKPGIVLSLGHHDLAKTVWVQKPVAPASMLDAAARIASGTWAETPKAAAKTEPAQAPAPAPVQAPEPAPTPASVAPSPPRPADEPVSAPVVPLPAAAASPPVETPAETPPTVATAPAPLAAKASATPPQASSPKPESLLAWIWRSLFGPRQKKNASPAKVSTPEPVAASTASAASPASAAPSAPPVAAQTPAPEVPPQAVVAAPAEAPPAPEAAALVVHSTSDEPGEAPPPAAAKAKAKPKASPREMAEAPRYCGEREDLEPQVLQQSAELYYNYGEHLISALRESYLVGAKWRAPTRLDLEFGAVTYVPAENRMYLDFSEDTLMAELQTPRNRRYKVRMVGLQEYAEMQEHLAQANKLDRFDAILWRLALETSKGRLPKGTDLNKEYYLRSWPNMTRFQPTPHAMRIAALWATRGASLLETAKLLEIPQRYVFAFYNAALSTDLITDDGTRIKRAMRKSHKNQSAFNRLFNWLRN